MPLTGSPAPQLAGSGVSAGGHKRLLQSHCEYPLTVYLCSLHGGQLRVWEQQQAVVGHLLSLGICHTVALQHGITGWRCRHRTCLILVTARWSQVIVPFPGSFRMGLSSQYEIPARFNVYLFNCMAALGPGDGNGFRRHAGYRAATSFLSSTLLGVTPPDSVLPAVSWAGGCPTPVMPIPVLLKRLHLEHSE